MKNPRAILQDTADTSIGLPGPDRKPGLAAESKGMFTTFIGLIGKFYCWLKLPEKKQVVSLTFFLMHSFLIETSCRR